MFKKYYIYLVNIYLIFLNPIIWRSLMIKIGMRSPGRIVYPKSKHMWAQQKYNEPGEFTRHRSQDVARAKAKELLRKERRRKTCSH